MSSSDSDGFENLDTEEFVSRNEKAEYFTNYNSLDKRQGGVEAPKMDLTTSFSIAPMNMDFPKKDPVVYKETR